VSHARLSLLACLCLATLPAYAGWIRVAPEDRAITVDASGTVVSSDTLRFGPPPSRDWRTAITNLAREGVTVGKGDMLAQFDASATDDRVRMLHAQLNTRRSELESLLETQAREMEEDKVRLEAARSAADKAARKADVDATVYAGLEYQKLLEERDIAETLYRTERERGRLVERVRDARRKELEADIRRLESELASAQQELDSFTIRAPRTGLVIIGADRSGQKLDINDSVNPGMTVVELANPDALVVQAEVPEYAAASIAVGQEVDIAIDAAGGTELAGEVISVASIVRRQSQYSQAMVRDVTVSLPESAIGRLRPGMSAKITITVDVQRDALAVPEAAIVYRNGKPGVVLRGGRWQPVVLGRAGAGMFIVEEGLDPGTEVAL
jgi:HlyD family secretion protein